MPEPARHPAETAEPSHRRPHVLWVAVAAAVACGIVAVPAAAHPSGPPPVAELTATGRELVVEWSAADDDYAALAVAAGALPDVSAARAVRNGPTTLEPAEQEAARTSPVLADYVAGHVSVTQDGQPCELSEVDTSALFSSGLIARTVCPAAVTDVEVEIGLLTDLDPAYRTVAVASGPAMPQKTMYTADRSTLRWEFGTGGDAAVAWWVLAAVAVACASAVVAGAWLIRGRRGRA